jgi:hypothetical protein
MKKIAHMPEIYCVVFKFRGRCFFTIKPEAIGFGIELPMDSGSSAGFRLMRRII